MWKVGGKVFAVAGWNDGEALAVTFKCSPLSFDLLKEQKGLRPAPYLASRGMSWIQRTSAESMDDAALKDYLRESHQAGIAQSAEENTTGTRPELRLRRSSVRQWTRI